MPMEEPTQEALIPLGESDGRQRQARAVQQYAFRLLQKYRAPEAKERAQKIWDAFLRSKWGSQINGDISLWGYALACVVLEGRLKVKDAAKQANVHRSTLGKRISEIRNVVGLSKHRNVSEAIAPNDTKMAQHVETAVSAEPRSQMVGRQVTPSVPADESMVTRGRPARGSVSNLRPFMPARRKSPPRARLNDDELVALMDGMKERLLLLYSDLQDLEIKTLLKHLWVDLYLAGFEYTSAEVEELFGRLYTRLRFGRPEKGRDSTKFVKIRDVSGQWEPFVTIRLR